jgi:hypothetical protein
VTTFRGILRTAFYCCVPFTLASFVVIAVSNHRHPVPASYAPEASLKAMISQSVMVAAIVLSYVVMIATPIVFWRSDPKLARSALLVIAFCIISSAFAFPAVP